jgi:S-DNA-T family DNA segregation ATPase FtsK/SpoIIIE
MKVRISRTKKSRRLAELSGLALLFLAVASLLSLLSYSAADPSVNATAAGVDDGGADGSHNWFGWIGASLANLLLQSFGVLAFVAPIPLALYGWQRLRHRGLPGNPWQIAGYVTLALAVAALLALIYDPIRYGGDAFRAGGFVGLWSANAMIAVLARPGALVLSATLIAAMIVLLTRFSLAHAAETVGQGAAIAARGTATAARQVVEAARAARDSRAKSRPAPVTRARPEPAPTVDRRPSIDLEDEEAEAPANAEAEEAAAAPTPVTPPKRPQPRPAAGTRAEAKARQSTLPIEPTEAGYALPPLDLLNPVQPQSADDEKELLERARQLTEKFHEFNMEGSVVAIHPGPVVTTFEFKPDAGVKYSKITSMTDDLCLALKAESVRIDRMPGRSTVGIEVPNRSQETIYPRELIASEKFRASRSKLTLALGKDIGGEGFVAELDRMPHLLIAGATGAGKSVMLNGMIVSLLYKSTPAEVRFIMIDTKMIELGIYQNIPHLLIPVVTDPKKASISLQWAVREMERRYHLLAAVGVRNIAQFNELLEREPDRTMESDTSDEPVPLRHLPYIVIVIDEMADLMMVSSADVEESIMRLAQMARAVGLHLILATQRPSVDVITGTIKANFPSRIAFRVSQRVDSRTIIDQNGAEQLLGRGDMLYLPTGSARLTRLHSGFITEPEINRLTAFLKKMAKPIYDESVLEDPEESPRAGYDGGERDTMFVEAVRLVLQEGQCSITLIQRRLRLGYARAARIVDMMEQEGVVGPADGSKPRELLVGPEYLESLEAAAR